MPRQLDTIRRLQAEARREPDRLDLANSFWKSLCSPELDVRTGKYVVEAFRGPALASPSGVAAICRASAELNLATGEKPSLMYFDDDLVRAIRSGVSRLEPSDQKTAEWLLDCLDGDAA